MFSVIDDRAIITAVKNGDSITITNSCEINATCIEDFTKSIADYFAQLPRHDIIIECNCGGVIFAELIAKSCGGHAIHKIFRTRTGGIPFPSKN